MDDRELWSPEKLENLPKITKQLSGRSGSLAQAGLTPFHSLRSQRYHPYRGVLKNYAIPVVDYEEYHSQFT